MREKWLLIVVSIPALLSSAVISTLCFKPIPDPSYFPEPLSSAWRFLIIISLIGSLSGVFWIFQSQTLMSSIFRSAMAVVVPLLIVVVGYYVFFFIMLYSL